MLDSSRTLNDSGPNPIQVSEIKAYLDIIDENDVDSKVSIVRFIKILDAMYLEHFTEKINKGRLKNG